MILFLKYRSSGREKSLLSAEVPTKWQRSNVENLTQNNFFGAFEGHPNFKMGCFADGNFGCQSIGLTRMNGKSVVERGR